MQGLGVPLVVRINTADGEIGQADLAWLAALPPPAAVMVPKAETVFVLEQVHSALRGVPTLALIESELAPLRFGFSGKLCIHPSQVAMVHDAFVPTAEELAWARKVLAADADAGGAAVQVAGRMVDLPVVLQARRTLAFAAGA